MLCILYNYFPARGEQRVQCRLAGRPMQVRVCNNLHIYCVVLIWTQAGYSADDNGWIGCRRFECGRVGDVCWSIVSSDLSLQSRDHALYYLAPVYTMMSIELGLQRQQWWSHVCQVKCFSFEVSFQLLTAELLKGAEKPISEALHKVITNVWSTGREREREKFINHIQSMKQCKTMTIN